MSAHREASGLVSVSLTPEQWEEFRTALRGAASIYLERPTEWPGEPEGYIRAARLIQELVELLPPPPSPSNSASDDDCPICKAERLRISGSRWARVSR